MVTSNLLDYIKIDAFSATPKYIQFSNSVVNAVGAGKIKKETLLPSINELSFELEISRDTAEKGYRHLKKIGILGSVPGKGYYITSTSIRQRLKIFLLFNKLSAHKKIVYDSFINAIGNNVGVDFYIYNNDLGSFKDILERRKEDYSHYVIIPHFLEEEHSAFEIINALPKDKLIILDKLIPGIGGEYAAVYQNFEKDIFNALSQAQKELRKYHTLKVIFPDNSYYPVEIIKGFTMFCQQFNFNYKVVHDIAKEPIKPGEAYINLMEDDLVTLIEKINTQKLKIGKQIGIISYNETPLKKVILNGLTTISTDFNKMGALAAEMILNKSTKHLEVPFYINKRASL